MLPVLPRRTECKECPLHVGPKSVGLPTRPADLFVGGLSTAVLLVGKAPAVAEDQAGTVFCGQTGSQTNHTYIGGLGLHRLADFYLTNSIRCKLPNARMAVPPGSMRACRGHLDADVAELRRHYERVVVLATGSEAIRCLMGEGVALEAFPQGCTIEIGGGTSHVFATYLAAALEEDPAKISAVYDHLCLFKEFLATGMLPVEEDFTNIEVDYTSRIPPDVGLISLDIETYGAVEGYPRQRFFHPAKSVGLDGVERHSLVQTVAVAWRDKEGKFCHRLYTALRELAVDLASLDPHTIVLGQNLAFDVMYLRAYHQWFAELFDLFGRFKLVDLAVFNFHDSDQRPERSLKRLAPLLQVASYDDEEISLKRGQRYSSVDDPLLHRYNVKDALVTLRCYEVLQKRIAARYPNSNKLTPKTLEWYSDLLWLAISMGEQGIHMDVEGLRKLAVHYQNRIDAMEERILRRQGITIRRAGAKGIAAAWLKYLDIDGLPPCKTERGTAAREKKKADLLTSIPYDTTKWLREGPSECEKQVIYSALRETGLWDDPRVSRTDVKKEVSAGRDNLILALQRATGATRYKLLVLDKFARLQKTLGTYLLPMLGEADESKIGSSLVNGVAYPTYHIVPSNFETAAVSETGGTQQGRLSAKGPAVQTFEPAIEACEMSRHPGGCILRIDMKQNEWRIPVMYSGDEELLRIFEEGRNIHEENATAMFGWKVDKKLNPVEYDCGKQAGGFGVQFRGGVKTLCEQATKITRKPFPRDRMAVMLRQLYEKYPRLIAWQDSQIALAAEQGYLEVPVRGVSRSFLGGEDAVRKAYVPTICNFPVQTLAALMVLDSQIESEKALIRAGLQSRLVKTTHDSGTYDCPASEVQQVETIITPLYIRPPMFDEVIALGYHYVPLGVSVTYTYNKE